jgi:hypothetical protein
MNNKNTHDEVALLLAKGAVALVLIIALGAFGRSFLLAILTHKNFPISDNATQLITALGSALVGGAVGFLGGTQNQKTEEQKEEGKE